MHQRALLVIRFCDLAKTNTKQLRCNCNLAEAPSIAVTAQVNGSEPRRLRPRVWMGGYKNGGDVETLCLAELLSGMSLIAVVGMGAGTG